MEINSMNYLSEKRLSGMDLSQNSAAILEESAEETPLDNSSERESNHASPLDLFATLAAKKSRPNVNSAEDFEKFLIAMVQDHLNNNETQLDTHRGDLEVNRNRKQALHEKLKEINIKINDDGTIAFLDKAQTILTWVTAAATVGSILSTIFTGGSSLIAIPVAGGFLQAWNKAIRAFFQGRREEQQFELLGVRHSHDLCADDLKCSTKVISKSSEEWSRLAHSLAHVIKNHGDIRLQSVQNINRR